MSTKEYYKIYYQNNKEKAKEYRQKNKEKIKESLKKDYLRHRTSRIEKQKEYYIKSKPKRLISAKLYRNNNKEKIKLTQYIYTDKNKGLICDLTEKWIKDNIISKNCIYCGDIENIGCDRIDNSKGHTKDNVVPSCWTCNSTRGDNYSFEEMKEIGVVIKKIKEKRKCQK